MGSFNSFGLSDYGVRLNRKASRKKGIAFAKENLSEKKYYLGTEGRSDLHMEVDRKTIGILLQILQLGLGISSAVIICEFIVYHLYDRIHKQDKVDRVRNVQLVCAPQESLD